MSNSSARVRKHNAAADMHIWLLISLAILHTGMDWPEAPEVQICPHKHCSQESSRLLPLCTAIYRGQ
jgi:hypothetical protein